MALYDPVDGVYRKVNKSYDPVSGTHRKVIKAYDDVEGVYRQYLSSGPTAGSLAIGDIVWVNVGGEQKEYLVVHQGLPTTSYDSSCDGTWLLARYLQTELPFGSKDGAYFTNNYLESKAHEYLNGQFLEMLDSATKNAIKQVNIPYPYHGQTTVSAKVFVISSEEVGYAGSGALDYFYSVNNFARRCGFSAGSYQHWALRTPVESSYYEHITEYGYRESYSSGNAGVRPAFILDKDTPIDQSTGKNIID